MSRFRLIAGSLIVFSAVSMLAGLLFSFEADDNIDNLVGARREKHTHDYMLRCAILRRFAIFKWYENVSVCVRACVRVWACVCVCVCAE